MELIKRQNKIWISLAYNESLKTLIENLSVNE